VASNILQRYFYFSKKFNWILAFAFVKSDMILVFHGDNFFKRANTCCPLLG